MKDSTKKYLGILGLLTVTIIWGGGFVASDIALATLTPFQIMFIRFFIAAVIMTALGKDSIKSVTREEIKCLGDLRFKSSHSSTQHHQRMHF